MRRLPSWLADGPEVSELAYRIVVHGLEHGSTAGPNAGSDVTILDVVEHLAAELDVDEGDVLLGFAELQRAGVIVKDGR